MCHAEFISASKIEILKQVQNDIIFRRYKKLLSILLLSFLFILISLYVYAVPNSPTVLKIEGKNVISGETIYLGITTGITVEGLAEANKAIKIYDGAALIGSGTSNAITGAYAIDVNLAAGSHSLSATASEIFQDGTLVNGPVWTGGKYGPGLQFDGINDYVNIPHNNSLQPPNITVEYWIKGTLPQTDPGRYLVIDKSHGFTDVTGWVMQGLSATGQMEWGFGDGAAWRTVTSTVNILDNVWHHIVGTYNGSQSILYIDGVQNNFLNTAAGIATNNRDVHIGVAWGGGPFQRWFKGYLDDVRIYNRALSGPEVLDRYNNTPILNGLITYWNLDENAGIIAHDTHTTAGESSKSPATTVVIDTTAPTTTVYVQQTGWRTNQVYMYGHDQLYGNLSDAGGSGLDLDNTTITVYNNTTSAYVVGTQGNNGVNRVDFYPNNWGDTKIHMNYYTITVTVKDKAGNVTVGTRSYYYDAVSPPAPTITKVYDPTHNVYTGAGEPNPNPPDGFGYVDYYSGMTINANPTNFKGNIWPINTYNTGYDAWFVWESSQYCNWCQNCTVNNGCVDGAGDFTWIRGPTQYFPEGPVSTTFYATDSANLTGTRTINLIFPYGTPQVPTSTAPYNGGEIKIIGGRLIPTITVVASPMGSEQTVRVYDSNNCWTCTSYSGMPWYNESQVVFPAAQVYNTSAGVYDKGDAFIDLNQNYQWDAGEPYVDSMPNGTVSDGKSVTLPNINGFEFRHNGLTYLVTRSGNTYGQSGVRTIGRFHNNDTFPPTLDEVILTPVDATFLKMADKPTLITAKEHNWGYDWYTAGYGVNTGVSKIEVLDTWNNVVSTKPTNWVYDGGLKYRGLLDTSLDAYPEGKYTIKVTLEDNLTNQTINTSNNFSIDNTPPNAQNIVPPPGSVSSIPSFNADIVDPPLIDGNPGSGAMLDLALDQIDPYKVIGLATTGGAVTNTLTVPILEPNIFWQAIDHRSNVIPVSPAPLPAGAAVQVWKTQGGANEIVGIGAVGNSTASNATVTVNGGGNFTVVMNGALTLDANTQYTIFYLVPHFDSNDGVIKVASVPLEPAITPGTYAARITAMDKVGNTGTTVSITSIQFDPPSGVFTLTPTPVDVYIVSPPVNERTEIVSAVIQGGGGTPVPNGTLVTISLSDSNLGEIVEPDANGIGADGYQIATVLGKVTFHVKAKNTTNFGKLTVSAQVGGATGSCDVYMRKPIIVMTKTADKTSAPKDGIITYTIQYENTGNTDAVNTIIKEKIPTNTTYEAGTIKVNGAAKTDAVDNPDNGDPNIRASYDGGTKIITVNMATLIAGALGTIEFKVKVQ